jgi:hypothetical protein
VIQNYLAVIKDKRGADYHSSPIEGARGQSAFDLAKMPHREGTGDLRFTRMEFFDRAGRPKGIITSGDSLKVRLHYDVKKSLEEEDRNSISDPDYTGGKGRRRWGRTCPGHVLPTLLYRRRVLDLDIDFMKHQCRTDFSDVVRVGRHHKVVDDKPLCYDAMSGAARAGKSSLRIIRGPARDMTRGGGFTSFPAMGFLRRLKRRDMADERNGEGKGPGMRINFWLFGSPKNRTFGNRRGGRLCMEPAGSAPARRSPVSRRNSRRTRAHDTPSP